MINNKIENRLSKNKCNYQNAYNFFINTYKNDYKLNEIKGKKITRYSNEQYDLNEQHYYLYNFINYDFGKTAALSEEEYLIIEGKTIDYCKFINCNFENIVFKNCSFICTKFNSVHFERVIFESCQFTLPIWERSDKEEKDVYYAPTVFEKCFLNAKFCNCDLSFLILENVVFSISKFIKCQLEYSIWNKCALHDVEINDCILYDFSICNTDILKLLFADEKKSRLNENTFFDYKMKVKKNKEHSILETRSEHKINDYDVACNDKAKTLLGVSRVFGENELNYLSGEYYYNSKCIEHKALHKIEKLISSLKLVSCGYGERPSFTFFMIIVTMCLFAIIYMFAGIDANGEYIKYTLQGGTPVDVIQIFKDYGKCIFFSITTFTTVGYGNFVPKSAISMFVSGIHMLFGVGFCALWTGCIFRKIIR